MSSEGRGGSHGDPRQRSHRLLQRVAYWGLVLVVAVVLVVLLLGFVESRDASEVGAVAMIVRMPHTHPANGARCVTAPARCDVTQRFPYIV